MNVFVTRIYDDPCPSLFFQNASRRREAILDTCKKLKQCDKCGSFNGQVKKITGKSFIKNLLLFYINEGVMITMWVLI